MTYPYVFTLGSRARDFSIGIVNEGHTTCYATHESHKTLIKLVVLFESLRTRASRPKTSHYQVGPRPPWHPLRPFVSICLTYFRGYLFWYASDAGLMILEGTAADNFDLFKAWRSLIKKKKNPTQTQAFKVFLSFSEFVFFFSSDVIMDSSLGQGSYNIIQSYKISLA